MICTIMVGLLDGINCFAWLIVYIELFRLGIKEKACGMPLFALSLNLVWEFICSFIFLCCYHSISVWSIGCVVWVCLDLLVLLTWVLFGRQYLPNKSNLFFISVTALAFVFASGLQLAFFVGGGDVESAVYYTSYTQNAAMSVMFIVMFYQRNNLNAQSLLIAICKFIGSFSAIVCTILYHPSMRIFVFLVGNIIILFDILYIFLLRNAKKHQ